MNNNKWTLETAIQRIKKDGYKGLTYWSAMDYLCKYHHKEALAELLGVEYLVF